METVLDKIVEEAKVKNFLFLDYLEFVHNSFAEYEKVLKDNNELVRRLIIRRCHCRAVLFEEFKMLNNPFKHEENCAYRRLFGL